MLRSSIIRSFIRTTRIITCVRTRLGKVNWNSFLMGVGLEEEKEEEEVEWRTGKPPRIVSADDDVRNWSNDGWMDD